MLRHGQGNGKKTRSRKQETVYHEECMNTAICTAIALQPIHLFQSLLRKYCILFRPPTPACIFIYFTPGLYRMDMGVFLRCGNGPEYTFRCHCSAYPGRRDRPTTVTATSLCIACNLRGSNVANKALIGKDTSTI